MDKFSQGLIDEIEFWQELLKETDLSKDSRGYQRLEYSLKLAQSKLQEHEKWAKKSAKNLSVH